MKKDRLPSAIDLAVFFHDTYERLAPDFGYETRLETREFNPSSQNGKLMIAVCKQVIRSFFTISSTIVLDSLEKTLKIQPTQYVSIPAFPDTVFIVEGHALDQNIIFLTTTDSDETGYDDTKPYSQFFRHFRLKDTKRIPMTREEIWAAINENTGYVG